MPKSNDGWEVVETSVDDNSGWEAVEADQPQQQGAGADYLSPAILGGTALGLGYAAKQYWQAPKRQLQPSESQFEAWRKQDPSLKGKLNEDVSKVLGNRVRDIGDQIKDFDETILGSKSSNLAEEISSGYPRFKQANYAKYSEALKLGEQEAMLAGKTFSNTGFNKDVIQKTLDSLKFEMPESEYNSLQKMIEEKSKVLTASGKSAKITQTLPLETVKSFKDSVAKSLPSNAQRRLNQFWGEYLENSGVKALKTANQKYSTFTKQDSALRKMMDPKTGIFNYNRLNKHIETRIKSGINSDFKSLMSALEEEVPEVGKKARDVYEARGKRLKLKQSARRLANWARKAEELAMEQDAIKSKAPIRTGGVRRLAGNTARTVANVARFGRPFMMGLNALNAVDQASIMNEIYQGKPGAYAVSPLGQLTKPSLEDIEGLMTGQGLIKDGRPMI